MFGSIYHRHVDRPVIEAPGYEDEVFEAVSALPERCQLGVIMITEELSSNDPDADVERCGLLADQYEVFAMVIPSQPRIRPTCRNHRLAVSIDLKSGSPPVATIHGIVPRRGASEASRRLVTKQLRLVNPTWE